MVSAQQASTTTGILLYSLGVFFFALNDALGKWLVAEYTVGQLMLLRTVGAVLILAPLIWTAGASLVRRDQMGLQVARILFMAADTYAFYYSTRYLPLADVMTYYMAAPLIITALSVPFLGEAVGPFRWAAVSVGFIGVLIALQPTSAAFSIHAVIALFGSVMYALAVTVTRRLRDTHWLQLVAWQFAGAGLIGSMTAPFGWVTPSLVDLGLLFLLGIVAIACFICITMALARTPASVLAPFQYAAIVWAGILGWLVWGDVPTWPIVIGNLVIVASGLVIFYREAIHGRAVVAEGVEPIP
ncbi:DMT family transporter [Prosthecomicrobium sp. N25]|uniref:DMT family transporter n=1 Tax=Prosthecomicrobium sp. N25 TaxID=3129254 RepID=UPI0030789FA0